MSWLVTSVVNSLKLDDEDDVTTAENPNTSPLSLPPPPSSDHQSTTPRGVKDDLSEFSETLTRQFWGVASFLAPPQISDHDHDRDQDQDPQRRDGESIDEFDRDDSDHARITGIRNDLSEIGGKFRTGISKLSSNKAVTEFTKIATNLLQFGNDEVLSIEEYTRRGVVGVTEEVVSFARDVSMHPETWIDFPLPDDDAGDFDLSDAQQEHALAVGRLAPELAALRTELCLGYMNEGSFWKIYFVLVHPRLSRQAAEILSTPQIVRARQMLTQELHSRHKLKPHDSKSNKSSTDITNTNLSNEEHLSVPVAERPEDIPVEISSVETVLSASADLEVDKHAVTTTDIPVIDKSVEEVPKKLMDSEGPSTTIRIVGDGKVVAKEVSNKQMERAIPDSSGSIYNKEDDDVDDWLKEESAEDGSFKGTSYQIGNDDVSFSDLEEDDDVPAGYKKAGNPNSSGKDSSDWIQLSSRSNDSSKVLDAKVLTDLDQASLVSKT